MPFQSEKQRRYLHANHPEIAKRWERDYANGGISNHFKLKDGGQLVKPGPGRPGYNGGDPVGGYGPGGSWNGGGGDGGYQNVHQTGAISQTPGNIPTLATSGGNDGSTHPIHTGPTLAELEARKKAIADAEHKEWITTKDKKKKKVEHFKTLKSKFDTPVWDTDLNTMSVKDFYDPTSTLEDYMNRLHEAEDEEKELNFFEWQHMDELGAKEWQKIKEGFRQERESDADDTPGKFRERKSNWQWEGGKLAFKAGSKKDKKLRALDSERKSAKELGVPFDPKKEKKYQELLKEDKEQTDEPKTILVGAKGGVARKNYFHGGILDINESEEIISDDGNDIELTAYNAEFDDPNDLSTGVKTLFQAKDGGTPQLAKKSKDGSRPGYGNPFGYEDAPAHHGDVAHGPGGRFDQPSGPTTETKAMITGDGPQVAPGEAPVTQIEIDEFNARERTDPDALNVQDYLSDEQIVNEKKIQERNKEFLEKNPRWKDLLDQRKEKEYRDNLNEVIYKIDNFSKTDPTTWKSGWQKAAAEKAINYAITQAAAMVPFGSIIMGIANILGLNVARKLGLVKTDISGNVINKNYVTGADLGFFQGKEYEDFWPDKDPDDPDDRGEKQLTIDLLKDEMGDAQGVWAPKDQMAEIRARQAKRIAALPDWQLTAKERELKNNPIVDETVTDITMEANSGGLANLFRVKNQ